MKAKVAFIGNPNVGKTELFNRFTGQHQHVGNWPGVTVEKKVGKCVCYGNELEIVDLPGTYSLTAYSIDELIARNFIIEEKPDVVVDIIDSTSLERNLYLTLSLLEMDANVVVALNMWDIARNKGMEIDVKKLEELLGVPVVTTVAITGEGIEKLKETIVKAIKGKRRKIEWSYGKDVEEVIKELQEIISKEEKFKDYPSRWLAIKIIEGDEEIIKKIEESKYKDELLKIASRIKDGETVIAERRYKIIGKIIEEVLKKEEEEWSFSDMLDHVFLHPIFGIPIFLALMYVAFQFTFSFSAPFSDMIDTFFSWLGEIAKNNISNAMMASFISDAVLAGVGSVLVFVPPIFSLFFALSLLENSGYLARAAVVMDRIMHKIGLHGKSIISMIMGFGCNIPGILAARTIENKRDRIITVMINPLMSCSARLPVYILLAGVIFKSSAMAGAAVFSMYLLGVGLAIIMAMIFRKFLFGGEPPTFIIELPRYMFPKISNAARDMWEKGKWFIIKAGTFIFLVAIIVWFLSSFPWEATHGGVYIENSYAALLGHAIEPALRPFGWRWQAGVALFFGFLAKEAIVGTFGALAGESASVAVATWFTPLTGFAYMAFVLIYFPCVATLIVMLREIGKKYTLITITYTISLAFIVAGLIELIGYAVGIT